MPFKTDAAKVKPWHEERHWSQEHLAALAGSAFAPCSRKPLIWWAVGIASHALTVLIVELALRCRETFDEAG